MHKFILALGLTVIVVVCSIHEGYAIPYNPGGSTSTGSGGSTSTGSGGSTSTGSGGSGGSSSSGGVAPHVPAEEVSAGAGSGIDVKIGSDELQPVVDASLGGANAIIENLQNMATQLLTGMAETSAQAVATGTGGATARAINSQGEAGASIVINNSGLADNNCSLMTTSRGLGPALSRAHAYAKSRNASTMAEINNEAGTTFENGLIDGLRKFFDDETVNICSPDGNGGKNVFCAGDGTNNHLTVASILNDRAITDDEIGKVDYFTELMTQTRTILDVSPDVLDDPKTDGKALFVEAERLKAEMSMFNTVLNNIIANNKVDGTGSAAVPYLKEIMAEGDFIDSALQEELLPGGQGSHMGQLEALTLGFMNPNYYKEKAFTAEKGYFSSLLFQGILGNYIAMQQLKLLESIALSTGAQIVVSREPAIEALNRKVQKANSGN